MEIKASLDRPTTRGDAGPWSGSLPVGTDETAGSSLPRDKVLADHLRDLPLKCDGELVVLDAFDLAIAEHGMMHRITDRECRRGNIRRLRLGVVVSRWFLLWLGFRLYHGARTTARHFARPTGAVGPAQPRIGPLRPRA